MMVGVPVLFWVWVGACWPFTWVMGVVVGVSGFWWCVFQCCVAVVCASRRVPGVCVRVSWLVPGACFGVGWLVVGACACVVGASVGVSWLVCVLWWFRMLTCLASFFLLVLSFVLSLVWLITGCFGFGVVVGACGVCACVVGASVGVSWLVCVLWWFRMLTCLASFFLLVLSFVLSLVWLITGCFGFGVVACVFVASSWLFVACLVCARVVLLCVRPPLVVGLVCGVGYWVVVLACLVCARILCVCGLVLFLFVGSGCVWYVWWAWLFGCGVCCCWWWVACVAW